MTSATPLRKDMPLEHANAGDLPVAPLTIDPQSVTLQQAGMAYSHWFVRLPRDFISDDLKRLDVWKRVQAGGHPLRRHDHIYLVAFDESWAAEAIVAAAGAADAVLSGIRIVSFPERTRPLFQDDRYRVAWVGSGYCVERKADGHRMTAPVASEALAQRDLANLYPRRMI
jgi:hypothetical protein